MLTRLRPSAAERHLDRLAAALVRCGWRVVRLYRSREFPVRLPMLWVCAVGPRGHVGLVVSMRGGTFAYHDVQRGRREFLAPCGDAATAAARVDGVLKRRMFPGAW